MKQTSMITGANSGIGLALTKMLIHKGWTVIALIRSEFPTADHVLTEAVFAGKLHVYRADLADMKHLKEALNQIKQQHHKIDVLFNNAGLSLDHFKLLPTNRDIHFEVNTLAAYIISQEMKGLLLMGENKMIINTSSNALLYVKQFDPLSFLGPQQSRFKKLFGVYAASKLSLSLWTAAVAHNFSKEGLHISSVDPGGNKTAMTAGAGMPRWLLMVRNIFFAHPSKGAEVLLSAALEGVKFTSGSFIGKGKAVPLPHMQSAALMLDMVDQIYRKEYAML